MKKKMINIIAILSIVILSILGIRNTYKNLICKDNYKTCQKDLSYLRENYAVLEKQVEEFSEKINSQKDTITKLEKVKHITVLY